MTRALLLNSGLAWAPYQVGVLRHLVGERRMHFDLCAGSGPGAVHAAFVACGEVDALSAFWRNFSVRRLLTVNWQSPWREGPLALGPLRKFIGAHVDEDRLRARGTELLFACLDAPSGEQRIFRYPGAETPLLDALVAAVSLPGLMPPLREERPVTGEERQWSDATPVDSFMIRTVLQQPLAELWAIAATLPEVDGSQPAETYPHWRAQASRALALNQARDVEDGLNYAQQLVHAVDAYRQVRARLPEALATQIPDPALRAALEERLDQVYTHSTFPWQDLPPPELHLLTPSRALDYPLWRFRRRDIRVALTLGYTDAHALNLDAGDTA